MRIKKKIALVVGASKEAVFAIESAKKLGFYVIAFDGCKDAEGLKYADEYHIVDIKDAGQIIHRLGSRIPDVILPVPIGRYLVTSGFLNEYFDLKGPYCMSTNICTDKYLFHERLHPYGLRNIDSELIINGEVPNIKNLHYPIIVKPRFGSGNREVRAFFTKEDFVNEFVSKAPYDEDFIAETLIQGTEYGVDGAVINGNFKLVLLREKKLTNYPFTQCIGYYSITKKQKDLLDKVNNYLTKIISVLKIQNALLHCDLMITEQGEPIVIELSPRPSGHFLHNNFTIKATGIDAVKEYLHFVLDKISNFTPVHIKEMLIRFFNFENCKITKIPNAELLKQKYNIIEYVCNLKEGDLGTVKDGHSLMNRGYFILDADTRKLLDKNAESILNNFEITKYN